MVPESISRTAQVIVARENDGPARHFHLGVVLTAVDHVVVHVQPPLLHRRDRYGPHPLNTADEDTQG